jgi:hypothetical protein
MAFPLTRPSLPAVPSLAVLALGFSWIAAPSAGAADATGDPFAGTYAVVGTTLDVESGDTRRIEGHLVLTPKGDLYTAVSELSTAFPSHGGPVHTDVLGNGEGKRAGDTLSGTAHTQLVMQTVPGVDTNFAFIPRRVGPRLVSTWKAHLDPDGTLVIELANQAEEGETYRPTKTTLRGKRVPAPQEKSKTP